MGRVTESALFAGTRQAPVRRPTTPHRFIRKRVLVTQDEGWPGLPKSPPIAVHERVA
jgi:hypothetical protein